MRFVSGSLSNRYVTRRCHCHHHCHDYHHQTPLWSASSLIVVADCCCRRRRRCHDHMRLRQAQPIEGTTERTRREASGESRADAAWLSSIHSSVPRWSNASMVASSPFFLSHALWDMLTIKIWLCRRPRAAPASFAVYVKSFLIASSRIGRRRVRVSL